MNHRSSDVTAKNSINTHQSLCLGCTTIPAHSFHCQGKAKHSRHFSDVPCCIPISTIIILTHLFFLILRMVLSIAVAKLNGVIVLDLVRVQSIDSKTPFNIIFKVKGDGKGFLKGLSLWFLLAIPSMYTNSMASTGSLVELSY